MAKVPVTKISYSSPARFSWDVYSAFRGLGLGAVPAQLLTAHVAISTGWGRATHNWMLAGIKAGSSGVCYGTVAPPSRDYVCLCTRERTGSGAWAKGCSDCPPKNGVPQCRHAFRSYDSLKEAAAAVLSLLQASRYRSSYAYLLAGDPRYFAQLGRDGWYTALTSTMDRAMRAAWASIRGHLSRPAPTGGLSITRDGGGNGGLWAAGLVGVFLLGKSRGLI